MGKENTFVDNFNDKDLTAVDLSSIESVHVSHARQFVCTWVRTASQKYTPKVSLPNDTPGPDHSTSINSMRHNNRTACSEKLIVDREGPENNQVAYHKGKLYYQTSNFVSN